MMTPFDSILSAIYSIRTDPLFLIILLIADDKKCNSILNRYKASTVLRQEEVCDQILGSQSDLDSQSIVTSSLE